MLKRLEGAKATKTLQKDELNRELFNTTYVGVPLGVIHAQKSRTPSRQNSSPYGNRPGSAPMSRRPRSATRSDTSSVMSDATSVASTSSTVKSRPGAGRGRPKSAHNFSGTRTVNGPNFRAKRPDWESGW